MIESMAPKHHIIDVTTPHDTSRSSIMLPTVFTQAYLDEIMNKRDLQSPLRGQLSRFGTTTTTNKKKFRDVIDIDMISDISK